MKKNYISPDSRICTLYVEGAFLGLTGVQMQVDESVSHGYDSATDNPIDSDYYLNLD